MMNLTIRVRNIDDDRRRALLELLDDVGIDYAVASEHETANEKR